MCTHIIKLANASYIIYRTVINGIHKNAKCSYKQRGHNVFSLLKEKKKVGHSKDIIL